MTNDREAMDTALKEAVIPELRRRGFKGSLPHFRRQAHQVVELVTFQFDKWGGGFVIEIARASSGGFVTTWGKEIPPNKVTTWDLPSSWRHRIKPRQGSGTDAWFRFEGGRSELAAKEVMGQLVEIEEWFRGLAASNAEVPRGPIAGQP